MSNQQSSGSGGSGDNGNGGEESDEDSSSSSPATDEPQINPELIEFREKWQKELKITDVNDKPSNQQDSKRNDDSFIGINDDEKAQQLFLQGVELERHGKVFDAIHLYRRAIQLVPDIEFKIYEQTKLSKIPPKQEAAQENTENANKMQSVYEHENDDSDNEDLDGVDLIVRFKNALSKSSTIIAKSLDKSVITSGAHFVDLPIEIILYILRWVVSADLDLRSLEQCAAVCRGLYLCARDSEIWRQACVKVWGVNVGTLNTSSYVSWRQMFLERERVLYNGCYISKTSYLRYGENSFQDQFYRPVQLVEYYRYFRFFPDGQVLMMTTADEPQQAVQKLTKQKSNRSEIFKGHYRLHNDLIIIVTKRNKQKNDNTRYNNLHRGSSILDTDAMQSNTFCIEFRIISTTKRRFSQLQWKHYSTIQIRNKTEVHTDFDLLSTKYPPLWFSRVKSYHAEAEKPLDY